MERAGRVSYSWGHPLLRLYHGTNGKAADAVLRGIDLGRCRGRTDFGRGFYTTTSVVQAWAWASRSAGPREPGFARGPAVVWFDVPREQLGNLVSMAFVRSTKDADDYWSLVRHCRDGGDHRRPDGQPWYDWVCGPVAKMPLDGLAVWRGFDQFSFHTELAAARLDHCNKDHCRAQ